MGWFDCHLHEFQVKCPTTGLTIPIGIPDPEWESLQFPQIQAGWEKYIADFFMENNRTAAYEYDFGDGWTHRIELEQVTDAIPRKKYPKCIAGERACPPENVGGTSGYNQFVKVMMDPSHEEYEEYKMWYDCPFNPEIFIPEHVQFGNPKERLNMCLDFQSG